MWRGGGPRDSCAAWFLRQPSSHTSCSHHGLFLPFMPLPELLCLPGVPSSPLPAPVPTCGPLGSYVQTQSGTSSFPEDALPGPGTLEPLLLTPLLWSLHPSCPPAPKADTSQSPGDIWWCSPVAGLPCPGVPALGEGRGKCSMRGTGGGEGREDGGTASRLGCTRCIWRTRPTYLCSITTTAAARGVCHWPLISVNVFHLFPCYTNTLMSPRVYLVDRGSETPSGLC